MTSPFSAVNVPFLRAPAVTRKIDDGAGLAALKSSMRVKLRRTGRSTATGQIRRVGLFLLAAAGGGAVHAQLLFVLAGAHAHDRRIGPHRVEWVDGWVQRFLFALDALCAVLRGGLALAQDHRYGLTYVRGAFEGHDDAAVVDRGADVAHGQILGGEDGHHT